MILRTTSEGKQGRATSGDSGMGNPTAFAHDLGAPHVHEIAEQTWSQKKQAITTATALSPDTTTPRCAPVARWNQTSRPGSCEMRATYCRGLGFTTLSWQSCKQAGRLSNRGKHGRVRGSVVGTTSSSS